MKLLLIHGRAQEGKNPTALESEWLMCYRKDSKPPP